MAILSLAFVVPSSAFAANGPKCAYTLNALNLGGITATASSGITGVWTSALAGTGAPRGDLVQGLLTGTFTSTPTGTTSHPVNGAWSFNKATGKLLMKVSGDNFEIDFAFLNLPSAGFTFQGSLHRVGQQPIALVMVSPPYAFPLVVCA